MNFSRLSLSYTIVMLLNTLLFLNLGGGEVVMILMVVLLLFGANKIPELARGLGKGMREFKDATNGIQREIQEGVRKVQDETAKIQNESAKLSGDILNDTDKKEN